MLFTNQQQSVAPIVIDDDYETVEIRIGQKVKYYDDKGGISHGEIISWDVVDESIVVITGSIIQYKETVCFDDLIEG